MFTIDSQFANWFGIWDISLLAHLRSFVPPDHVLAPVVMVLADAPVLFMGIFLIVWWLYGVCRKTKVYRLDALQLFLIIFSAFLIYFLLNQVLPMRPRPETIISGIAPLIDHTPDNSFPSGHATFAAASVFALHVVFKNWGVTIAAFLIAGAMCVCRVIAGIHYPSDILFGWILGTSVSLVIVSLLHSFPHIFERYYFSPCIRLARFFHL